MYRYIIVIILLVLTTGCSFFEQKDNNQAETTQTDTENQSTDESKPRDTITPSITTIQTTPTKNPANTTANNYKQFTSINGYNFSYPNTWTLFPYDEGNPNVITGTHVLTNYDVDKAQSYTSRGVPNWKVFMGVTPAIKIDINTRSLQENNLDSILDEFLSVSAKEIRPSDLRINDQETLLFQMDSRPPFNKDIRLYVATIDDVAFLINIYSANYEIPEQLIQHPQWEDVKEILKSFSVQ